MDERAMSELAQGQSAQNRMAETAQTINEHNQNVRNHFQDLRQGLDDKVTGDRHEDEALDTIQGIGDISTGQRFLKARSLARAQLETDDSWKNLATTRGAVSSEGRIARGAGAVAEATGLRTAGEMIRQTPAHASSAFARAGSRISEARGITNLAESAPAEAGVPTLAAKMAQSVGVASKRAAAIGDVVGHSVGAAMAGYNIVNDLTMSHKEWENKDPEQKAGNVLGIAGGVADTISAAVPILAPIALGLNVASAYEDWQGDKHQATYQDTRKGGLADQESAQTQKGGRGGTSVMSSGLAPQGATSVRGQTTSSGAF